MSEMTCITGWGAVSPAGWGASALAAAVNAAVPLPFTKENRGGDAPERRCRRVPAPAAIPEWMKHPRMRRTTTVARHAVAAAMEAIGAERLQSAQSGAWRVGVVFCTMNGCVQFSRRFFNEVIHDPRLASPILFPETVYNAPASHLSALLNSREMCNTLVGDSAQFIRGMEMAAMWLEDGEVDAALIVAAEELDWLSDEALMLFDKQGIAAEGAAAVLMERCGPDADRRVCLSHITQTLTYGREVSRHHAAQRVMRELCAFEQASGRSLLADGLGAGNRADAAEQQAWSGWKGLRASVRPVMGEGFGITSGWQVVHACESLAAGSCDQALISAVGLGQQAVGAVLANTSAGRNA